MDNSDPSYSKDRTSVLFNRTVAARRKRMEIRRLKKVSRSLQLPSANFDSGAVNSTICIKRAGVGGTVTVINPDELVGNSFCPTLCTGGAQLNILLEGKAHETGEHTVAVGFCEGFSVEEEGSVPLISRYPEERNDLPPSGVLQSISCHDIPLFTDESGRMLSETTSEKHSDSSPAATAGMVDLDIQSSRSSEPIAPLIPSGIDRAHQNLSDNCCPPSGKLLVCGRRREMEDTAVIVPSFSQLHNGSALKCFCLGKGVDRPSCGLHFFAVYDGHGGPQASRFCMERLHHALAEELSSLPLASESGTEPPEWPSLMPIWREAMVSCFLKVDKEVGGVCPYGECGDIGHGVVACCRDSIAPENVGTTAVVAVVSDCQIVVANCGDSRAVLSRGGKTIALSMDHKPEREDERKRIEAADGRVIYWDGYRVGGLLALSRSIGDRYLKQYVVSEPEVTCMLRTEEDECLILASDGLWDVVSNDTACEIARKCLLSKKRNSKVQSHGQEDSAAAAVAALLVKLAYGRGSKDNISVVVVDLKHSGTM
ncbi:hypothetical protein KP509_31G037000 [Ceratopteris richardii]|uniref:protein-serine/threonine phosphatase n=1 Tax=Ceratopteris richardii TaxID=49495 RepID=A0A8T2QXD9_CERRI|nr:hypothetical protein KP509_31G037000 [Ceratopteris richardii]KAH7288691.1 hypothetical protein KP509_31G037000 [Ceratopteris richardii]